jgi:hypothetical protein
MKKAFCVMVISCSLAACSVLGLRHTSPALKATIVQIANTYLTYVAAGNERHIVPMVYWDTFLKKGTPQGLSREEYSQQMAALKDRWPVDKSPFVKLQVINIDVNEDVAEIKLRRGDGSDYPTIWIKMIWSGSGWLIAEDSIFGKDKLAAKVMQTGSY